LGQNQPLWLLIWPFTGSALLQALSGRAGLGWLRSRTWPRSPNHHDRGRRLHSNSLGKSWPQAGRKSTAIGRRELGWGAQR